MRVANLACARPPWHHGIHGQLKCIQVSNHKLSQDTTFGRDPTRASNLATLSLGKKRQAEPDVLGFALGLFSLSLVKMP